MAGNCETITNSAEAEARVEAWAELGKNCMNDVLNICDTSIEFILCQLSILVGSGLCQTESSWSVAQSY